MGPFAYWTSETSLSVAAALLNPSGLEKLSCSQPRELCLVKTRKINKNKTRQESNIGLKVRCCRCLTQLCLPKQCGLVPGLGGSRPGWWALLWLPLLSCQGLQSLTKKGWAASCWPSSFSKHHLPPSTLHVPFSLWPRFYPTDPQKGSSVRTTTYLDDLPHFWGPFLPKCCPLIALPHFIPCSLPTPVLPWCPRWTVGGGSQFHAAQAQHWSGSWTGIFMFKFYSTSGNFPIAYSR